MGITEAVKRPPLTAPARRFTYPTQAVFLSQAAMLEEAGPPRIPAIACFLGFTLVLIGLVTAAWVKIDVISSSSGQLISSSPNQSLQSFDRTIVSQVHIREGQVVDKGDVLLTLKDPEAEAQLGRLQARRTSLAAQAKRLGQLIGIEPLYTGKIPPETVLLSNRQMAILPLDKAAASSERALVQAEISRVTRLLENLLTVRDNAELRLTLTEEKLAKSALLHKKGLISTTDFIEGQQEKVEAQLNLAEVDGQVIEAEASLVESKQRLLEVIASSEQRQASQLSSIMVELGELDQQIEANEERLERSVLKAPLRSVVHQLHANFVGQIMAPGDILLDLIPIDEDLLVDARLPTSEIGHVAVGQQVRIAVDGIEPHRAGYLEGYVQRLSPSTFIDEKAVPYYRALIALKSNQLGQMQLIPGMTVQAQIKTDRRTILEYLLKPVYRAWNSAFRER